ncbi:hypothetical protein BU24DRAFT_462878 [Aaosphaeria arxii CBS 175.79]|uniref:Uncharacterized protein n=1 Tax=Aaosphaeria arxii CBS 175.79 TaxID=1450172 RepID=A0A6A5XUZ6_9PLEO|nr:uncharacterized protein BU24DRAFT_462878 [Aaosphaeria arxii CBS 175.79]KAF2016759.1 hypothetical protein BU24DRAFT_462878 [Aaosphaeria arxii CBS 175.79]
MRFSVLATLAIAFAANTAFAAPGTNTLVRRECDCAGKSACTENCDAFPGGTAQAACRAACADVNNCGLNEICCKDGSACTGKGCCAA